MIKYRYIYENHDYMLYCNNVTVKVTLLQRKYLEVTLQELLESEKHKRSFNIINIKEKSIKYIDIYRIELQVYLEVTVNPRRHSALL